MATTTITGLSAVLAADLTDAAVLEVDDANVHSRKATIAQLRTQLLGAVAQTIKPGTHASYDLGLSAELAFRDLFLSRNALIGGTLGVTGVASFTEKVLIGTTVTNGASAGDLVLANQKAIRGLENSGTVAIPLVFADSVGYPQLGTATLAGGSPGKLCRGPAVDFPAGSTNLAGIVAIDQTNNRLCYYSNGARYYLTGTSF